MLNIVSVLHVLNYCTRGTVNSNYSQFYVHCNARNGLSVWMCFYGKTKRGPGLLLSRDFRVTLAFFTRMNYFAKLYKFTSASCKKRKGS